MSKRKALQHVDGEPFLNVIKNINNSVSHVLFLSTQAGLPSYVSGSNHLSTQENILRPSIRSFPSGECPYHNLGFSLVGFTSFHLTSFLASSVTVAPSGSFGHIRRLRRSFRRQSSKLQCLPLFFQVARTLRASQHRVSMDFPLRSQATQRLLEFLMTSLLYTHYIPVTSISLHLFR